MHSGSYSVPVISVAPQKKITMSGRLQIFQSAAALDSSFQSVEVCTDSSSRVAPS